MNKPHLAPRTVREWLDLIPFDRARKEAIEDYDYELPKNYSMFDNSVFSSLSKALCFLYKKELKSGCLYCSNFIRSIKRMEQSVKLKQQEPPMMGMRYQNNEKLMNRYYCKGCNQIITRDSCKPFLYEFCSTKNKEIKIIKQ